MKKAIMYLMVASMALAAGAQQPVMSGKGSYAAYPPAYKASTAEHPGFNATAMLTRHLYINEKDASGNARPIPTNDWWTDLIVSRYSGAMWSYPAMVKTSEEGVRVSFPTRWSDNGTEVLSDSWLTVGGAKFSASEARACDWHDWDVEVSLPAKSGQGSIKATLVHGVPFTWLEFNGVEPRVTFSAQPRLVRAVSGAALVKVGDDYYGLYYPESATFAIDGITGRLGDSCHWLSVAVLGSEDAFDEYAPYAASVVRSTEVGWRYDEEASQLKTDWIVKAENLREKSAKAPVLQGFLPHAYKHACSTTADYTHGTYLTPRGIMKMAASDEGRFSHSYIFHGFLPYYAAPQTGKGYNPDVMKTLMADYAAGGGFGGDTYWGGKGLTQMALNMTFAKQTGYEDIYEQSKAALRSALADWLSYTPGEETRFFSYYPRWGGMLGFDVSYDSDAFNDHHFHYGYFIYAAALLCMEDDSFAAGYGDLLRMIVKDYANYDRRDSRFPFLRTLDPWAGHSYAGGLGDHGNDNGNGQESSSEAMQAWGGMYLLGVALGDNEMRDAGIFGWLTESRGTLEYWFDRDHIYPERRANYDYSRYRSPYNTNLTSKGIGWWTWFSGDPLWMHSIQWMPVSPCLNYMSEDLNFVKWDYEKMQAATDYSWFSKSGDNAPLADQSVGNVVLCYMERYDPEGAAAIFDEAWARGSGIAKGIDTGHISYFVIHSHLTYGDIDYELTADCPTANAYRGKDGAMTYMVYNPDRSDRRVIFRRNGAVERTVMAPARKLTVFTDESAASSAEIRSGNGFIIPPGSKINLTGHVFDQYGAELDPVNPEWSVSGRGAMVSDDGSFIIAASAIRGSEIIVTYAASGLTASEKVIVNDAPAVVFAIINGIPDFVETGTLCSFTLETTDQYGNIAEGKDGIVWTVTGPDGNAIVIDNGEFEPRKAGRYTVGASVPDGVSVSSELIVLPPLPDVAHSEYVRAVSSSEENTGTATANAIDGDTSSRWGSAHSDSQWYMVDLGKDYRLSSITILWEAAFGADYDIEVAPDGCALTDYTGNYAGTARSSRVPAESAWQMAYKCRNNTSAGEICHPLAATGRYVRMKGLRRGSAYGYSILELSIGGVSADASSCDVAGLDITAPEVALEGGYVELEARRVHLDGSASPASGLKWSSEPAGVFIGDRFIPQTYGLHTITASSGAMESSVKILVEESVKLVGLEVSPSSVSMLTGSSAAVTVTGQNQFGGEYPVDLAGIGVSVCDSDGKAVDASAARFDIGSLMFTANERGDYKILFGNLASVDVTVRDVAEANLAAGCFASASSSQGGNTAANVTDMDLGTRWESGKSDNEWIDIDLGGAFVLDRVVLHWEGAYAREYSICTSLDGETWHAVYTTDAGKGGVETVPLPDAPAQYVRVHCIRRATEWANSIYEIEVYGKERFSADDTGTAPDLSLTDVSLGNGSVSGRILATSAAGSLFLSATVSDDAGHICSETQAYGTELYFVFEGLRSGEYVLMAEARDAFGNSVSELFNVRVTYTVEGLNLALGKPVKASSSENVGLAAVYAVDGDMDTRWGSEFADGENIIVDLGEVYRLDNIRIYWNRPAYATHYDVEVSVDGKEYSVVCSRSSWDGSVDNISFEVTPGRYVKITGLHRATTYGTSINELEVYGHDPEPGMTAVDGVESDVDAETAVFTMQGLYLGTYESRSNAIRNLVPGLYIFRSGKLSGKVYIPILR